MTFLVPGWSQVFEIGGRRLGAGYHGPLHGNDPKNNDYNLVGREHVKQFARFVQLQEHQDSDGQSCAITAIVYGSGMGDSTLMT